MRRANQPCAAPAEGSTFFTLARKPCHLSAKKGVIGARVGDLRALTERIAVDAGVVLYPRSGRNVPGTTGNDTIEPCVGLTATVGYVNGDLTENVFIVDNYVYYAARAELPFALRENAALTLGLSATDVNEGLVNSGAELTASASLAVTF